MMWGDFIHGLMLLFFVLAVLVAEKKLMKAEKRGQNDEVGHRNKRKKRNSRVAA